MTLETLEKKIAEWSPDNITEICLPSNWLENYVGNCIDMQRDDENDLMLNPTGTRENVDVFLLRFKHQRL